VSFAIDAKIIGCLSRVTMILGRQNPGLNQQLPCPERIRSVETDFLHILLFSLVLELFSKIQAEELP
jgi:hypothetical protein